MGTLADRPTDAAFSVPSRGRKSGDSGGGVPTRDPRDESGWLGELQAARKEFQRNGVLMAWAMATGGKPRLEGETLVAELPGPFLNCAIANLARRYGWDVRGLRQ